MIARLDRFPSPELGWCGFASTLVLVEGRGGGGVIS